MRDIPIILQAAEFAANKHRNQRRKDHEASPYINHPLALAKVLASEAGITDPEVICAALLHDTIEDTETTAEELSAIFGEQIASIVLEVSDDKTLSKPERKQAQIAHAAHISKEAKCVKLADKICNLRDVAHCPPTNWTLARRQEYFDWAKAVIDQLRGADARLEAIFDQTYQLRPTDNTLPE